MHPVSFNIMAGSALPSFLKNWVMIKVSDFGDMQWGIEIFVDMATLTVLTNYLISFSWSKVALKSPFNVPSRAS
jgi:hypothetical protein